MKVIAGEYGGRRLKSLAGNQTRPTSAKIKGSIFNMIGPFFEGGQVLDLYAGSGSLAIEAVSRGCDRAYCVDRNYQAIQIIHENIQVTKEPAKFIVKKATAERALSDFAKQSIHFDLVFLDPPYAEQEIIKQIENLQRLNLVDENSKIICEISKEVTLPPKIGKFICIKHQLYGTTEVIIYESERNDD